MCKITQHKQQASSWFSDFKFNLIPFLMPDIEIIRMWHNPEATVFKCDIELREGRINCVLIFEKSMN